MSPRALLVVVILLVPVTVAGLVATGWAYTVAHIEGAAVVAGFTVIWPGLTAVCAWLHRRELLDARTAADAAELAEANRREDTIGQR